MLDQLDIYFSMLTKACVKIDGATIGTCDQLHTSLTVPSGTGIRMLTVEMLEPGRVEIVDVKINGSSVRHLLYLSWTSDVVQKWQPCTALWEQNQTWHLPFGTPVSWWIDCVLEKIPQHMMGQDLSQYWDIMYPKRINLPSTFPPVVRDFFAKDFSFTAVAKNSDPVDRPWRELAIDPAEVTAIANQSMTLWKQGQFDSVIKREFDQDQYNRVDDPAWTAGRWEICKLLKWNSQTHMAEPAIDTDLLPEFFDWIKKFTHVHHAQINFLQPNSYIAPHRDFGPGDLLPDAPPRGCTQCYIPLQWQPGSYLKLAGAGILDTSRAWAINNADFTHSVVNTSNTVRSVLIVRADMQHNQHLLKNSTIL